jgi:SAM-dependent methyltransferase
MPGRSTMGENKYLRMWRELVLVSLQRNPEILYKRYEAHTRKKSERPDPLLDYVLLSLDSQDTVIDIGPGNGRWTIPLARIAKRVTAVEPTTSMVSLLKENIDTANLDNVDIINSTWEEVTIEPHDITVCAHAMYSSLDLAAFVQKMEKYSVKRCYLSLRIPPADSILGELAEKIFQRHFDSPNAILAFNALYSLGIYPNVIIEDGIKNWTNSSIEEAFSRAKQHLYLDNTTEYDDLISETLKRRLHYANNVFIWPDGMRSALLWWNSNRKQDIKDEYRLR